MRVLTVPLNQELHPCEVCRAPGVYHADNGATWGAAWCEDHVSATIDAERAADLAWDAAVQRLEQAQAEAKAAAERYSRIAQRVRGEA